MDEARTLCYSAVHPPAAILPHHSPAPGATSAPDGGFVFVEARQVYEDEEVRTGDLCNNR